MVHEGRFGGFRATTIGEAKAVIAADFDQPKVEAHWGRDRNQNEAFRSLKSFEPAEQPLNGIARLAAGQAAHGENLLAQSEFASRSAMLGRALSSKTAPVVTIAGQPRLLNASPDAPDLRDRIYQPTLRDLNARQASPNGLVPLDQGQEGACTGFALAAAVNRLNAERRKANGIAPLPDRVSPRMLYEMAKLHDEWPGENYSGSSLRGAMKGFFHNGVCSETIAPYNANDQHWSLSVAQAKDARTVALGAYYRLLPDATHYHAALNEVDVICASARVHDGWRAPVNGRIVPSRNYIGGHAFAIVGYDDTGFLVLNSWGKSWGGGGGYSPGVAHWSYEDWAENVLDAWVLRLSVPTPDAFHLVRSRSSFAIQAEGSASKAKAAEAPRREEVVGHIINIDQGVLQDTGRYATPLSSLIETAEYLAKPREAGKEQFRHIMFFAHGGLNSLDDAAVRAAALREPLKRNGIYPIFFLWGTDFPNEFQDAIVGAFNRTLERVGGVSDFTDRAIELLVGKLGRAIWREIKRDAEGSFDPAKAMNGFTALREMLTRLPSVEAGGPQIHLVGHSAGSILLGHLVEAMRSGNLNRRIDSVQLLAPACTLPFFDQAFRPSVGANGPGAIQQLDIYNLTDKLEQDDNVLTAYQKSLLYLVSNACEETSRAPLLGMEAFTSGLALPTAARIQYAGRDNSITASTAHGGFDNDLATMTSVVARILGRPADADKALRASELGGY